MSTLREIEKLSLLKNQEINEAKKILAYEVTKIVRGKEDADEAQDITPLYFRLIHKIYNDNESVKCLKCITVTKT